MDKQLSNLRPSGTFTVNVLCGLVKGLSDERVVGCGTGGRLESFYYDLQPGLISSVSLCPACAAKQTRLVRYSLDEPVTVTLHDGQATRGTVHEVLGWHRAGEVFAHTDVWYRVQYWPARGSMPVVGLFRQSQMREVR